MSLRPFSITELSPLQHQSSEYNTLITSYLKSVEILRDGKLTEEERAAFIAEVNKLHQLLTEGLENLQTGRTRLGNRQKVLESFSGLIRDKSGVPRHKRY